MGDRVCGNCRYWNNESPQMPHGQHRSENGTCQRNPPVISDLYTESLQRDANGVTVDQLRSHQSAGGVWPITHEEDWCGEYAPANPETVTDGAAVMARLVLLGDLTAARALADKLREGD